MNIRNYLLATELQEHPFYESLDSASIVCVYETQQLITDEELDRALDEVRQVLADQNAIGAYSSASNAIPEFALNAGYHAKSREWLAVQVEEGQVCITVLGVANPADTDRIRRALVSIQRSVPNHDQEQLFKLRSDTAWRNRKSPAKKRGGAGLGLLTISALACEHLTLEVEDTEHGMRAFKLQMKLEART